MEWTVRRINSLIDSYNYSRYLEIGVSRGETFKAIKCDTKIGVDPFFRFDWRAYKETGAELHEVPSDEYFSARKRPRFDCVFVDGLHTFEQTLRDVVNAMDALEQGGAIIIDDTIPIDEYSAMRSQGDALAERKLAGRSGQFWHGDVYKVLFFLNDYFRGWDFATIIGSGNPQTLVWRRQKVSSRKQICDRISDIDLMSFEQFQSLRRLLPECSEEEAFRRFSEER